jgi:hypothetical protein
MNDKEQMYLEDLLKDKSTNYQLAYLLAYATAKGGAQGSNSVKVFELALAQLDRSDKKDTSK